MPIYPNIQYREDAQTLFREQTRTAEFPNCFGNQLQTRTATMRDLASILEINYLCELNPKKKDESFN